MSNIKVKVIPKNLPPYKYEFEICTDNELYDFWRDLLGDNDGELTVYQQSPIDCQVWHDGKVVDLKKDDINSVQISTVNYLVE